LPKLTFQYNLLSFENRTLSKHRYNFCFSLYIVSLQKVCTPNYLIISSHYVSINVAIKFMFVFAYP